MVELETLDIAIREVLDQLLFLGTLYLRFRQIHMVSLITTNSITTIVKDLL